MWPVRSSSVVAGRALISQVTARDSELAAADDSQLRELAESLKYRARCGEPLSRIVPDCFALVRQTATRTIGLTHRPAQLLVGAHLLNPAVVELPTGEGKTLAATLSLAARALMGRGAWLATANDYLAQRDADWMEPLFRRLGLSVGCVQSQQSAGERRAAYGCDITYGTLREFGFDFLRDRRAVRDSADSAATVQRELYSLLLDEADSLLLDEARTPLIISDVDPEETARISASFPWAARMTAVLVPNDDWVTDPATSAVYLTDRGRSRVRRGAADGRLRGMGMRELYDAVTLGVRVLRDFRRDRDYVVRNGRVVIVDPFTGRLSDGRRWRAGIHEMLEAAEGVAVQSQSTTSARITVQALLKEFEHLAGMTGTCWEARAELRRAYGLQTWVVPPSFRSRRIIEPPRVCDTVRDKWREVTDAVARRHAAGRPVLVGTRDVAASESLSAQLASAGLPHAVLNAREEPREAELIARAGERGAITVATSMAGRGTDIRLGPGVFELGGLHVIATELYDSVRVDRQLAGRCGRQGDPGSLQQILSLEDAVLDLAFGRGANAVRRRAAGWSTAGKLRLLRRAQAVIEQRHRRERGLLQKSEKLRQRRYSSLGYDPYLDDLVD